MEAAALYAYAAATRRRVVCVAHVTNSMAVDGADFEKGEAAGTHRTLALTAAIDCPTLLVYGDQDARAPLSVAEHLSCAIANSSLIVLPGVGHLCNLEDEHAFNAAVRTWLRNHT